MRKTRIQVVAFVGWLCAAGGVLLPAQQTEDLIVYNAKILTVDDASFSSRLGTIAQAMHVRDGKILHIGNTAQIRGMAGPSTRLIDVKNRTVLPGFILTHEHPWDWGAVSPATLKKVLTDDVVVTRILDRSPEENLRAFPGVLAEAVRKARPGQWIYILFTFGENYEYAIRGNGPYGRFGLDPKVFDIMDGKRITKEQLDQAAPNNPVLLRDVFVATVMNQKAIDESIKVFPDPGMNPLAPPVPGVEYAGSPSRTPMRWMLQDVALREHYPKLVELQRLSMEWWAGYGMTSFSSNVYSPSNLRVFREWDRRGQMAMRNMWTWNWRPEYFFADPFSLTDLATRTGEGSDYLWYGGAIIAVGAACTAAQPVPSSKLAPVPEQQVEARRQTCAYSPGSIRARLLHDFVKAGGRFVNLHTVGDQDIDNIMNIIVQASKEAGMTEEDIRAKRHGFDHGVMWPRPDQIAAMKQYGFISSGDSFEIPQASPAVFDIYGERGASWVVPKKRLVEGGIYNSMETDRALPSTNFTIFSAGIAPLLARQGWDGKTYASDQAVDRQTALKIATTWGAYYLLREKVLGSLEPGKWADFIVLDRDYLTIPEADIGKLRVLMTVVGGKVVHLVPSVAREIGMRPVGAQVELGPAGQW
ncbi:MAG: hypothetical protein A3H28_14330 [Acidobacteria bacterium RIFCSPLOWO2_02_FULL_61_28]|nr:MAG: hypothetical protein A3H28_14330 [Acidobacteria bacterium RIFCSPLOWO2_02_FULL_61_28]